MRTIWLFYQCRQHRINNKWKNKQIKSVLISQLFLLFSNLMYLFKLSQPLSFKLCIVLYLWGQCHEMDIFCWRYKHFNQYFLCMRWRFSRSFRSFSLPYTIINFLLASLKLLTNFENDYRTPPQNFLSLWLVDVL